MINISIVIPIFNESENIKNLVFEIFDSLDKNEINFELILVDDGSNDNTLDVVNNLKKSFEINLIKNNINSGQSFSILKGIKNSLYDIIVTLDGDGQNNPSDINKLIEIYAANNDVSLVGGIRQKRKDSFVKRFSSIIANKIRSFILRDNCIDTGCSLKIFKKNIFMKFPYFDGMHRFLPALFIGFGQKTIFINVDHRPRKAGISKYGTIDRLFRGIRDILKVLIILQREKKKKND